MTKRKNWTSDSAASAKSRSQKWRRLAIVTMFGLFLTGYLCLVAISSYSLHHPSTQEEKIRANNDMRDPHQQQQRREEDRAVPGGVAPSSSSTPRFYTDWRELAVRIARQSPADALTELNERDPFGTRAFAKRIADAEELAGGPLPLEDFSKLFGSCPVKDRISWPDQRDPSKAAAFRQGTGFLFFQHLRKAGGTHFCSMAEANFPKENLPPYYCMPDYHWPHNEQHQSCAGCLHHWSNHEIVENMKQHRIAGNEWDSFDPTRHFELPAVMVTSFRKPLDRALSQYRFECVEDRGCKIKDVGEFWRRRRDLYNVYTWTFSDVGRQASFATAITIEAADARADALGRALDTIARFHLVLAMEWIPYAETSVKAVLGFSDTSTLTKRVRPHNEQKQRSDSWKPEDYLSNEQYVLFSQNLALDEILTDAAHRLFLERLVCDHL